MNIFRVLLSGIVLLLLASGSAAQNRVKLQGIVERGGKQIITGGVTSSPTTKTVQTYPSAVVSIFLTGTSTLASLCSDNNSPCTAQANPFSASASDASWSAFVNSSIYDIRFAPAGVTAWTVSAVNTGLSATSTITGANVSRVAKLVLTSTYTVLAGDAGKQLVFSNAGAVAVTLPQAGTGSFTSGYWVDASVIGGGTVTITPATSTINGATSLELSSGTGISGLMNDGTNWYGVVGGSSTAASNCPGGTVCPDDYGAVHDGSSHLLSSRYGTLAAAQSAFNGAYSFVTSLSQQIDYAAVKAASNAAFGADQTAGAYITPSGAGTTTVIVDLGAAYGVNALAGQTLFMRYPNGFIAQEPIASNTATTITLSIALPFDYHTCSGEVCLSACALPPQTFNCSQYAIGTAGEHGYTNAYLNKPLYLNPGNYQFVNNTWTIRNLVGGHIYGGWRESTNISGSGIVFQTDGIWSSRIEGITFTKTTTDAGTIVDIDGNVPGHPYATRSVQQNTFADIKVDGASGTAANTFGVYQCRQGGSSAQCENLWINPQISSVNLAFFNNGFNALANKIERGDMQDFVTGVYSNAGSVNIDGTSFESGHPYEQATQGGFDVHIGEAGVLERMVFSGIRSESLQVFKGSSTQPATLQNIQQSGTLSGATTWSALSGYTLHQVVIKTVTVAGVIRYHAFFVSTIGTSGAVEPVWPATGTITDGSVVWTELPFFSVDTTSITGGQAVDTLNIINSSFLVGQTSIGGWDNSAIALAATLTSTTTYQLPFWQWSKVLIPIDVTGGSFTTTVNAAPIGTIAILKRIDATGNVATIAGGTATIDGGASLTLPSQGTITIIQTATNVWRISSKNFGLDAATLNGATFATPGTIGGGAPGAATFTTLISTGGALNGTLGATTPNTGAFTNLTVSGLTNGVKRYVAFLTQTGTSAPVATVKENTLGFTPTYGYTSAGIYTINSSAGWTATTGVTLEALKNIAAATSSGIPQIDHTSTSVITLTIKRQDADSALSGVVDELLSGTMIRIEIYP